MTCEEFKALFAEPDRQLTGSEVIAMVRHTVDCNTCRCQLIERGRQLEKERGRLSHERVREIIAEIAHAELDQENRPAS